MSNERLEAAIREIEALTEYDREQGGFPWELDRAQEPNIRAANDHLHRRVAELEAENNTLRGEVDTLTKLYAKAVQDIYTPAMNGDAA